MQEIYTEQIYQNLFLRLELCEEKIHSPRQEYQFGQVKVKAEELLSVVTALLSASDLERVVEKPGLVR